MPEPGAAQITVHGTCVDLAGTGVLILGSPGAGKSDLALRLIDAPGCGFGPALLRARLVADDQVVLARDEGDVFATAPARLAGLLEVRGIGILELDIHRRSRVGLIVRLAETAAIERLPEAADTVEELLGLRLPSIRIDPRPASAASRVRAACQALAGPAFPARLTLSNEGLRLPATAD